MPEAQVVASQLVAWFQQHLLTAEAQRDAADDRRVSAEDDRRASDRQRAEVEQQVIEAERLLIASEERAEQWQHALDTRIVIEQAEGFVAARCGVTPNVAFEAGRRRAAPAFPWRSNQTRPAAVELDRTVVVCGDPQHCAGVSVTSKKFVDTAQ